MDGRERLEMLRLLEDGQAALLLAVDGVSDEMAARQPGAGRWSILGCVEHLGITEEYLFGQIAAAEAVATPVVNREREAKMLARGTDRSRKMESPAEGNPQGRFGSLKAAVAYFLESRRRTEEFVAASGEDLRARMTWHPILKEANVHEMLISMGVHCLRHVRQIEEIRVELEAAGVR